MPKKKTSTSAPTPIASVKHKDTRKNIPTEELRDFRLTIAKGCNTMIA